MKVTFVLEVLTLVFFSIASVTSSEVYTSNDFTATCSIVNSIHMEINIMQTNIDRSPICLIDTFPYLAETTTGNGIVPDLGDVFQEVLKYHLRGN
jgi:hypothetical protein